MGIGAILVDGVGDDLFWARVEWLLTWTRLFENEWLFWRKMSALELFCWNEAFFSLSWEDFDEI